MFNQLVATGGAVAMQIHDGDAQGGAGGLAGAEEEKHTVSSWTKGSGMAGISLPTSQSLENTGGRSQNSTAKQK